MAVRRIIRMGHPGLRIKADPVSAEDVVSEDFARLLDDMTDTLHDYGGIGLAATQIDVPLRVAIIELAGGPSRYGELPTIPLTVFINPTIEILSPATAGYWEGCLSVPGLRGFVERPQHIRVTAHTATGEAFDEIFEGFPATVFQHEFDHLDGRLYVDRISEPGRLAFEEEYSRYILDDEAPAAS